MKTTVKFLLTKCSDGSDLLIICVLLTFFLLSFKTQYYQLFHSLVYLFTKPKSKINLE